MRVSPSGHSTAPDTVVPPPKGMMTTLNRSAACGETTVPLLS